MALPQNAKTTPLLSQMQVTGTPAASGSRLAPLSHESTHHTTVSWGDEATVHRDKAAAVQGLWEEKRAEMPEALGLGGDGHWATTSLAVLKPMVRYCPGKWSPKFKSWPGPS